MEKTLSLKSKNSLNIFFREGSRKMNGLQQIKLSVELFRKKCTLCQGKGPSIYYVSIILDFFQTHPPTLGPKVLHQHKYSTERQQKLHFSRPQIHQSTIYYAGLLGRWDKRIVNKESDVPSIIIFILFID
jgi:hypothetical protein